MTSAAKAPTTSPSHRGEREVQARLGVRTQTEDVGRQLIRNRMTEEHRAFFEQLPFVVLGSVDMNGRVWASIACGRPGFMKADRAEQLKIAGAARSGDPLFDALTPGAPIGLLGIELETRRRNRVNGQVTSTSGELIVDVTQAFGNCPKYIQQRAHRFVLEPGNAKPSQVQRFERLDSAVRQWIEAADTFFIASLGPGDTGNEGQSADVSHRGGKPGFVRVLDDDTLLVPDYAGNNFFNTLGNLTLDPRAGLLFVDFASGDLLQLSGGVEISWDGPEVAAFEGAERAWRFALDEGVYLEDAIPLRWEFGDYAPTTLAMGTWQDAQVRLDGEYERRRWRAFRVIQIEDESETVRSFYLAPAEGGTYPDFQAGQHLPLRLPAEPDGSPTSRTYTLSMAPADRMFRISVKREPAGVVSSFLHRHIQVGDTIEAQAPSGDFLLSKESQRPVVLISAGVGITPMIAMLRQLVADELEHDRKRPVWFVHGDRNGRRRPFLGEIRKLAEVSNCVRTHMVLSSPDKRDQPGQDYNALGHIDVSMLQTLLPFGAYDFYLCGPAGFMQTMYDGLRAVDVPDNRIFAESFGPATLRRTPETSINDGPAQRARVRFARSNREADWAPERGTLLDLIESEGLDLPSDCRQGTCGTCVARLVSGYVHYTRTPTAVTSRGEVLTCSTVPKAEGCGSVPEIMLDL